MRFFRSQLKQGNHGVLPVLARYGVNQFVMVNVLPNVLQLFHFMSSNSNQLQKLKTVNPNCIRNGNLFLSNKDIIGFLCLLCDGEKQKKNCSLANSIWLTAFCLSVFLQPFQMNFLVRIIWLKFQWLPQTILLSSFLTSFRHSQRQKAERINGLVPCSEGQQIQDL